MKGLVALRQRKNLIAHLQKHEKGALKRLAHAVEAKENRADTLNYSRMHHRHNKNLATK